MKNKLNYNTVKNTSKDAIASHIAWLLDDWRAKSLDGGINPVDAKLAENCLVKLDLLSRKYYAELEYAQPIRLDAWGITDDVFKRVFNNNLSDDDAYICLLNYF